MRVRAARLHAVGDLRVAEEPEPAAEGPDMSLVRVTAVGICGSDLHWWDEGAIGDARISHPLVLGHEGAGVIADGPRRGERVAIDPADRKSTRLNSSHMSNSYAVFCLKKRRRSTSCRERLWSERIRLICG